ncbi:hypothetical protein UY3_09901 [Chelonia mydas]|uniref:Uncharacterized protein n=1 Tax=Chelonia mydas TaxID=8469 RepID=M7BLQ9_CHEMY|nr:hypothetical protein UY3_09901 [Chelonia mydas]
MSHQRAPGYPNVMKLVKGSFLVPFTPYAHCSTRSRFPLAMALPQHIITWWNAVAPSQGITWVPSPSTQEPAADRTGTCSTRSRFPLAMALPQHIRTWWNALAPSQGITWVPSPSTQEPAAGRTGTWNALERTEMLERRLPRRAVREQPGVLSLLAGQVHNTYTPLNTFSRRQIRSSSVNGNSPTFTLEQDQKSIKVSGLLMQEKPLQTSQVY